MNGLLGMEPRAAFPIMMGSGAFMGIVAAMRFVSSGRYSARASLGLTVGGIPGVFIAVWLVRSLPLDIVRWGVIVVVLYTAVTLIRSAIEERRTLAAARAAAARGRLSHRSAAPRVAVRIRSRSVSRGARLTAMAFETVRLPDLRSMTGFGHLTQSRHEMLVDLPAGVVCRRRSHAR